MLKFSKHSSPEEVEMDIRIGQGIDFHRFQKDRKMILGGVDFKLNYGLKGHSDADVVLHAISDSILGACGLHDIGYHFPDTDNAFKDADSSLLLSKVMEMISSLDFTILNIDITVIAEKPKINKKREEMVNKIASLLGIVREKVNLKGTTTEKMGFIGREEGMAAMATVLVVKNK